MAYRKKTMQRRRPAPKKKGGVVKRAIRKAKKSIFAKRVKAVVTRLSETKVANYAVQNRTITTIASADWDLYVLNLLPQDAGGTMSTVTIAQGDSQSTRDGNQIRLVSGKLTGVIKANVLYDPTYNYDPKPMRITLWIVKLKPVLDDTLASLESVVANSFFQNGAVSTGFQSTTIDLTRSVNADHVTLVKKRTFNVGAADYSSSFGVGSAANVSQRYANNDTSISHMFRIDITKHLPKMMRFNDGSNNCSNSRKLWMFWSVQRFDGTIPLQGPAGTGSLVPGSTTGPTPAFFDLGYEFRYKDM